MTESDCSEPEMMSLSVSPSISMTKTDLTTPAAAQDGPLGEGLRAVVLVPDEFVAAGVVGGEIDVAVAVEVAGHDGVGRRRRWTSRCAG